MNIENIEIIIELLKKNNVSEIVISPGGTNMEFVKRVQTDDAFNCYSVVDERSAIYFAIGLYLNTGRTIVCSCTSAQATRNYIPGLTEAFYKRVPILAITMMKHPRFTYQEYMQAPDQTSMPVDSVKKSFMMPFINEKGDYYQAIRVANEAINELTHNGKGPVQLAVPWLDFPLHKPNILPCIRKITRKKHVSKNEIDMLKGKKILLIIGENRPIDEKTQTTINSFCDSYNVVVYTNHLSNFHNEFSVNANLQLLTITSKCFHDIYAPDIMISIGGQTGDYPLYNILANDEYSDIQHWRVSDDGKIIDTYDKLTYLFEMDICDFFSEVTIKRQEKHDYYDRWRMLVQTSNTEIEVPFSHVYVAQKLHKLIPHNSIVQFSILHSLRIWNFFILDPSIKCYSNVGAFGIDGGLSTLIGQSVVCDELCFMIIGDLAFLYDINAIAIRHIKNNLRILLVNNDGGIEFKLGGANQRSIDKFTAAAGHFKNASGWAKTCGFKYIKASNKEEFNSSINEFIDESNMPIIFEVFVTDVNEAEAYQSLIGANTKVTAKDSMILSVKETTKRVIGMENIQKIKGLLKDND